MEEILSIIEDILSIMNFENISFWIMAILLLSPWLALIGTWIETSKTSKELKKTNEILQGELKKINFELSHRSFYNGMPAASEKMESIDTTNLNV